MTAAPGESRELAPLMRLAQDGDSAAYADLLRAIIPILRKSIATRIGVGSKQDAEDVLQEVLVSVHRARATYDPDRPFLPWLMAIARNRTADAARGRARKTAHEMPAEQLIETFPDPATNIYMDGYRDTEALKQAISRLPERQRQAIELLKLREMSLKEAAASTGMSIGALKLATHRAIARLRLNLSNDVGLENG